MQHEGLLHNPEMFYCYTSRFYGCYIVQLSCTHMKHKTHMAISQGKTKRIYITCTSKPKHEHFRPTWPHQVLRWVFTDSLFEKGTIYTYQ